MTLSLATVAPLLMPDYTTRMNTAAAMCLSPSCSHPPCYLQDRDEIADDVIIAPFRNRYVKVTAVSVIHHGAIRHKPTGYRRIHKSAFSELNASIHSRFALSHVHAPGILHHRVRYIAPVQGILPTSQLNATVRAAFMPDSTLEFLLIFSSSKCTKPSIFSGSLHS